MKLQKATCFALFAVLELAADPTRQLAAAEIAEKYDISLHHLAKVLRDLGRAGIVDSARGVGGGYRFSGNPKRLTLMDVIERFEPIGRGRVNSEDPRPNTAVGRAMRLVLDEIDEHTLATFRSITISTMLKIVNRGLAYRRTKGHASGTREADSSRTEAAGRAPTRAGRSATKS